MTYKEDNNIRKLSNKKTNTKDNFFDNQEVNDLFLDYLEVRKKNRQPNTDRAMSLLLDKLNIHEDEIKIKMLENAIVNSWKSVYPLREEQQNKHHKNMIVIGDVENETKPVAIPEKNTETVNIILERLGNNNEN